MYLLSVVHFYDESDLILALCSYADDTSGLTWGGQSYETSDALVSGVETTEIALISAGVDLHDTEVVLLNFVDIHSPTGPCCRGQQPAH